MSFFNLKIKSHSIYMNSFITYMKSQGLSEKTITEHSRNLIKFKNLGGDIKWSENKLIDFIKQHYNEGSQQKIITSTISKYRHYKGKTTETIRDFLRLTNNEASLLQRQKNEKLKSNLPDIDFKKMLNDYYRQKQYKNFVILFLLMNYNTRNRDLVLRVTNDEAVLNDDENFLFIRDREVVYIRNDYKTKERYGTKRDIIKAKKFFNAVQGGVTPPHNTGFEGQSPLLDSLLINNSNLDRQVKAVTGGINQSTMFKMLIAKNNNLKSIEKASKNRGTNMETIATSYDIT